MNEILENIDEGVHFVNKDGKTIIYNNSVQKMEKMNRHDILTNSFFESAGTYLFNGGIITIKCSMLTSLHILHDDY